jgi:hypothetical protein
MLCRSAAKAHQGAVLPVGTSTAVMTKASGAAQAVDGCIRCIEIRCVGNYQRTQEADTGHRTFLKWLTNTKASWSASV